MCGFIGILSSQDSARACFEQGVLAIRDRGSSIDTYHKGIEHYGYSRLPTDDVSNQDLNTITPKASKLLFNGLITNVAELQEHFKLPERIAHSDQRCLRLGLEQEGIKFLKHCRGMFACASIDANRIALARDTIGIKPLYYIYTSEFFAFASELKALRCIGKTIYEVLPGQAISFDKRTRQLTKQVYSYQGDVSNDLLQSLMAAVIAPTRRYLDNSTKDIAVLLSGGLDSSVIAKLLTMHLSEAHQQRVQAFCIGEDHAPDVIAAKRLATVLGLQLTHIKPYCAEQSLQKLPDIVYKVESPYARVAKVALLYDALASEIKAHGIDVVIGGEGADELFYGYHRFIDGLTSSQTKQLFDNFYRDVFPDTLLQRYDRIFARHQVEGRVPYLDQAIVAYASSLSVGQKISQSRDGHISKLPLRAIAKTIGLPAYIYERGKEKMTAGATGKHNETSSLGYLEQEAHALTGSTFQELVTILYRLYFGTALAVNSRYTEERLAQQTNTFKQHNMTHERNTV